MKHDASVPEVLELALLVLLVLALVLAVLVPLPVLPLLLLVLLPVVPLVLALVILLLVLLVVPVLMVLARRCVREYVGNMGKSWESTSDLRGEKLGKIGRNWQKILGKMKKAKIGGKATQVPDYTTLRFSTYTTLQQHYTTLHCTALHCTTLHYATLVGYTTTHFLHTPHYTVHIALCTLHKPDQSVAPPRVADTHIKNMQARRSPFEKCMHSATQTCG